MSPRCKHCGRFVNLKDSAITWDYTWNPDIEYFHNSCQQKFINDFISGKWEEDYRAELTHTLFTQLLKSNKEHGCKG